MKTISSFIIIMAMASIFGGLGLWAMGLPKLVAVIMFTYGTVFVGIHLLMQDKIESIEIEQRNRNLYK